MRRLSLYEKDLTNGGMYASQEEPRDSRPAYSAFSSSPVKVRPYVLHDTLYNQLHPTCARHHLYTSPPRGTTGPARSRARPGAHVYRLGYLTLLSEKECSTSMVGLMIEMCRCAKSAGSADAEPGPEHPLGSGTLNISTHTR
jgi:hypothetical protein